MKIIKRTVLQEVPSASGIEFFENQFYLIGDNSPWIFEMDNNFNIQNKIQIIDSKENVIPKSDKPDFEAMTAFVYQNIPTILVFGSGSKSPQRDNLIRITFENGKKVVLNYSLTDFYNELRKNSNLSINDFNLEAALATNDKLLLFNRANNLIFIVSLQDFFNYIINKLVFPKIELKKLKLPEIQGIESGFSGASLFQDNKILFTSSVENTKNWIDDGDVLGSFIGVIDLDTWNLESYVLKMNDEVLKIKVESVTFVQSTNQIYLVTDSDGKESELLEIEI